MREVLGWVLCVLLAVACAEGQDEIRLPTMDVVSDSASMETDAVTDTALPDAVTGADTATGDADVATDAPDDTLDTDVNSDTGSPPDTTMQPDDTTTVSDTSMPPQDTSVPCVPDCSGKACGDDGCGDSCGSCGPYEVCDGSQCGCDDRLPPGWPSGFTNWSRNPVLVATSTRALQGQDNIYAPDIHRVGDGWAMWYGAQAGQPDGHDRIYLATSADGVSWRKYPSDGDPQPVLPRGGSNHINDPSVVWANGAWYMYYTDAPTGIDDEIWLATSTTLQGFQKVSRVLDAVPNSWEEIRVGRPAVLYENGVFKMWYDGASDGGRHVGYAESTDGVSFTRHAGNPVFRHAGAIDVEKVGDVYVLLHESGSGTNWATSTNGICWVDRGQLFAKSGQGYDQHGQVTPHLQLAPDGSVLGVWYGGAKVATWNENRIAVAWADGASVPAGGGCTGCTSPGLSCAEACHGAGQATGTCGAPGSTNPGACCACAAEGCEGCTAAVDCQAACVGAGKAGGWCGWPGSTNPSQCCVCL